MRRVSSPSRTWDIRRPWKRLWACALTESPRCDVDRGLALRGQVGQDRADQARELEAVAAARAGDDDVPAAGEKVEAKVLVGGDCIQAGLGPVDRCPASAGRRPRRKRRTIARYVIADRPLLAVGVDLGPAVPRGLHPHAKVGGHAVEVVEPAAPL